MLLRPSSRVLRLQWQLARRISRSSLAAGTSSPSSPSHSSRKPAHYGQQFQFQPKRTFHSSPRQQVVKPVLLADIGEGIVECEIIQWFVEPEARVEEFSPLCEVQSDKASVEITSRHSGVVKKLYYEAGELAKVGKPFVDIDIEGDVGQDTPDELIPAAGTPTDAEGSPEPVAPQKPATVPSGDGAVETPASKPRGKHAALATPAVRHLSKERKIDILEVEGTGRDGRVLKEDIYRFIEARDNAAAAPPSPSPSPLPTIPDAQAETRKPLTKTQEQMFKTMTRSLNIPHFLYADEIDFSKLSALRSRLNRVLTTTPSSPTPVVPNDQGVSKLSYLPFIVKAVSIALQQYPVLNARVEVPPPTADAATPAATKPALVYRAQHNIGVAMDTPSGLVVPVIRNVASHSILTIAAELSRLQALAVAGKLAPQDMSVGTITVSNIGSIGGTYCSPVIVEGQVAILGVGRLRDVPDVVEDEGGEGGEGGGGGGGWKVKGVRKVCNFSWSADHRVVDGATMARAAGVVRSLVEEPDVMVMHLR